MLSLMLDKLTALFIFGVLVPFLALPNPRTIHPLPVYGIKDVYRGDFNQTGATGGLLVPGRILRSTWATRQTCPICRPRPWVQPVQSVFTSVRAEWFVAGSLVRKSGLPIACPISLKSRINEILDKKVSHWDYATGFSASPLSLVGYDVELTQDIAGIDTIPKASLPERAD